MKPDRKQQPQPKQQPKQSKKSVSAGQRKVFDVTRPGKAPASATSRPVITSHKPPIKDPDVSPFSRLKRRELMDSKEKVSVQPPAPSAEEANKPEAGSPSPAPAASTIASQPEGGQAETQPATGSAAQSAPEAGPAAPNTAPDTPPQPATPPKQDDVQPAAEAPGVGSTAVDGALVTDKQQPQRSQPSQNEQSKQPNEPLHMGMPDEFAGGKIVVSHHRSRRTLWLELLAAVLILLLLAAILNILLDAEIIKTDLNIPHTNFFNS